MARTYKVQRAYLFHREVNWKIIGQPPHLKDLVHQGFGLRYGTMFTTTTDKT